MFQLSYPQNIIQTLLFRDTLWGKASIPLSPYLWLLAACSCSTSREKDVVLLHDC